jgi:hypothetical protein
VTGSRLSTTSRSQISIVGSIVPTATKFPTKKNPIKTEKQNIDIKRAIINTNVSYQVLSHWFNLAHCLRFWNHISVKISLLCISNKYKFHRKKNPENMK